MYEILNDMQDCLPLTNNVIHYTSVVVPSFRRMVSALAFIGSVCVALIVADTLLGSYQG